LTVIADVGRNGHCELHVALTQTSHDSACEKCAEVGRGNPERDADDVARHGPQKRCAPAIFVGQRANDWRRDSLTYGEERPEGAAEQDNVVARVDRLCERVLVCVQTGEDLAENRVRIAGFVITVEFDELRKQR
jgi:hypothetical protein